MKFLSTEQILSALKLLGALAAEEKISISLLAVGGAVMSLRHNARPATRDVDVLILEPEQTDLVRKLATRVASEMTLPSDWLNDAAKAYITSAAGAELLFETKGLKLLGVPDVQLLAMKLSAWRDEVDVSDARVLLRNLSGSRDEVWNQILPLLSPGTELKAQYAFDDLWQENK